MSKEKEGYNKIYSQHKTTFGGGKPEKFIQEILEYKTSGTVLELGAGEGRNALFLAKNGFQVVAQDLSEVGIEKLRKHATEEGLSIQAEVGDVRALHLELNFDVIVSTFMLHHLTREEAVALLRHIQEHTNPDGLHVVTTFTQNGDFYRKNPKTSNFYPEEGELRELYSGWEVLEYEEKEGAAFAKKPDGTHFMNVSAKILARKI